MSSPKKKSTGKQPKPFWREARGAYYIQLGKNQKRLSEDKQEAYRMYPAILAEYLEQKEQQLLEQQSPASEELTVGVVFEKFLDHVQINKPQRTYEWYKERIRSYYRHLGADLPVSDLKPMSVIEWLDSHPDWQPGHRRGCIIAVRRPFRWYRELDASVPNPLTSIKLPPQGRRDKVISLSEFRGVLDDCPSAEFKLLLRFIWCCGCRPQEVTRLRWEWYSESDSQILIPRLHTKKKKRERVIYLSPEAKQILQEVRDRGIPGPVIFTNSKGSPWKRHAIACAFARLQTKVGLRVLKQQVPDWEPDARDVGEVSKEKPRWKAKQIKTYLRYREARRRNPRKLCLYNFRHSYTTQALRAGGNTVVLSHLLGHEDTTMVSRVYQHLDKDAEYLQQEANRLAAKDPGADKPSDREQNP